MTAQVEADDPHPLAELVDERAALEQQVVAVLAEAVDQHDGQPAHRPGRPARSRAARRRSRARSRRDRGRAAVNASSAATPVRRTVRTRRSAMTAPLAAAAASTPAMMPPFTMQRHRDRCAALARRSA